ncbi:hypothetical protein B0H11DRAFT_1911672 [Mycena galericulata]|nr:hypothetical protein B0H11DRAFT_1911672 [Mycena galericulata]
MDMGTPPAWSWGEVLLCSMEICRKLLHTEGRKVDVQKPAVVDGNPGPGWSRAVECENGKTREYENAKMRGKEGEVVTRDLGVLVAKQPTGDFPRGGIEVLRCYLWALALHWSQIWCHERRNRLWAHHSAGDLDISPDISLEGGRRTMAAWGSNVAKET